MTESDQVRCFLKPCSIAVVRASGDPGRIGGRPLRIHAERRFTGPVYPVNPKFATAQGVRCYPDIGVVTRAGEPSASSAGIPGDTPTAVTAGDSS